MTGIFFSFRFQNGVSAPHMLGNQLNPTSTMAQKMSDTLSQELEAHAIFTEASNSSTNLVGPQLHSRVIASVRDRKLSSCSRQRVNFIIHAIVYSMLFHRQIRSSQPGPPSSFSTVFSTSSNSANPTAGTSGALGGGAIPQTLDQLLERQWEQGSQFLMEQAQHFDSEYIARKNSLTIAWI